MAAPFSQNLLKKSGNSDKVSLDHTNSSGVIFYSSIDRSCLSKISGKCPNSKILQE